jgi:hypothetical protein
MNCCQATGEIAPKLSLMAFFQALNSTTRACSSSPIHLNERGPWTMTSIWESIAGAIDQDPIPVLGIIMGCGAGAFIVSVSSLAKAWARVRASEAEAALKQDMVARGMSADEIERVMQAGRRSIDRR